MRMSDWSSDVCSSDLVQRVELGIEVVEPELDRSRVDDLLVDPRLVEPQRADAGFDIADRLDVAGEIADRPTVVIEAVDMEQIGRESRRESAWQSVQISVVAASL